MAIWIGASWTRRWAFALAVWMIGLVNVGCATQEFPEAVRQTLAGRSNPRTANAAAVADAASGSLLVVMSYGFGCSGSGPGNGLRDVADTIRRLHPGQRVITRAWNDDDGVVATIRGHAGPVLLVGHSFGGSKSIEFAAAAGRPIDHLLLLDPVPYRDWGIRHGGKYFVIPDAVRDAVCFYRPAGAWPISYPIVNPSSPAVNRERPLGHAAFGESAEVREYILSVCNAEATKAKSMAGTRGGGVNGHS